LNSGNKEGNSGNSALNSGNKEGNSGNSALNSGNKEDNSGNNGLRGRSGNEFLMEISMPARKKKRLKAEELREIILSLCKNRFLTAAELSHFLNRNVDGLRKNHIKKLVEMNQLALRYPNTPNHIDQAYKTVDWD
jgi:ATP-dependent DNA helicase RecG